ncbi:MAG: four helix bundle protein [Bacteroidales bacterium]|nr:four helix bundle protein [Bacteroidales bacterium]
MMAYSFSFERLEVWQLARTFLKNIYPIIDTFPQKEKYNLTDQIRRAATSIVLNLAEMTSCSSLKEQAHFSEIAFGSAVEVYCSFLLAFDFEYISEEHLQDIKGQIGEITNKINALKASQYKRIQ